MPGKHGKLVPVHTPKLGDACRCGRCRSARIWTPEARAARSAEYRARVVAGTATFGSHAPKRKADRWTPEEDAALTSLLGTGDTATIRDELERRGFYPRTEGAVRSRIKVRKLSRLAVRPLSRRELAHALGVSDQAVSAWLDGGLIAGTPWRLGGGHRKGAISRAFSRDEVERFLRAHPERVQLGRIRDRGFRTLVEGVTRGRRPLALPEAARLAGVAEGTLTYWCRVGKVPSARKVGISRGHWRIDATDVPLLRAMPDGRTREARAARSVNLGVAS